MSRARAWPTCRDAARSCARGSRTSRRRTSHAGDVALTLHLVLECDRAPAERRQLDRPRHEAALVERTRRDLRDLLASRLVVFAEQIGIGRRRLDVDLLDLRDRD